MYENRQIWPSFQGPSYMKGSTVDPRERISRIRERAREVVAWFQQNPPGESLVLATRPEQLSPEWPQRSPAFELMCSGDLQELVVDSVCSKRAALVGPLRGPSLKGVRFLVYEAEEQMWDGASEFASRGFFDVFDEPGWATWIDHYLDHEIGHRLLCCIPTALEVAAQAGIDANLMDCIRWMECPELLDDSQQ